MNDEFWMRHAISTAKAAANFNEVPVGAVIVRDSKLISNGFNLRESHHSSVSHAEINAIKKANEILGSWRLVDCTMYVTLEPCLMCAGAASQAKIARIVFGAKDPKGGATGSLYSIHADNRLNHRFQVTSGVLESECSALLKEFFRKKR